VVKSVVPMPLILAAALLGGSGPGRSAAASPPPTATLQARPPASNRPQALLPAANEVQGWALSRTPQSYTADDLWQAIDGAADSFVAYELQEAVIANYKQSGTGHEAAVEIYRMKDPLHAFGKYSEERNPDYRFINVGNEGYSGGTTVNFWKGAYYVKMTSFRANKAVEQDMMTLARSIAAKVSVAGTEPPELAHFPRPQQIPRATRYLPRDVLGQTYFTHGFEARYKAGANESRLVLVVLDSAANARDALARYRKDMSKDEAPARELTAPGEGGFAVTHRFYGNLAAVRQGRHIVVALGTADEALASKRLAAVVASLR